MRLSVGMELFCACGADGNVPQTTVPATEPGSILSSQPMAGKQEWGGGTKLSFSNNIMCYHQDYEDGDEAILSDTLDHTVSMKDVLNEYRSEAAANTMQQLKTIPSAGITKLKVTSNLCGVVITPAAGDAFDLSLVGVKDPDAYTVNDQVSGNKLEIGIQGAAGTQFISTRPQELVNVLRIGVPASVILDIEITDTTGCVLISGLDSAVTASTANGVIRVQNEMLSHSITMESANGAVMAVGTKSITGKVKLDTANGDVMVKSDALLGTLTGTAQNGSVQVRAGTLYNAKLSASNGEVDVEAAVIGQDVYASVDNGEMSFVLTAAPVNLTFQIEGAYVNRDNVSLPGGWTDGKVFGDGKPVLCLKVANGDLVLNVADSSPAPASVWGAEDVKESDWFYQDVQYVRDNALIDPGVSGGFEPQTPMTRGVLVLALYRMGYAETEHYPTSAFEDVEDGSELCGAVEWARAYGIVRGVSTTAFAPDRAITREEMAAILARYGEAIGFDMAKTEPEMAFTDAASISEYARPAVSLIQQNGIIKGKDGGRFDPKGTATRAETAAILHRFDKHVKNPHFDDWDDEYEIGCTLDPAEYAVVAENISLKAGYTIAQNVLAFGNSRLRVGFVKQGDDPKTAKTFYFAATSLHQEGKIFIDTSGSRLTVEREIEGDYKIFVHNMGEETLTVGGFVWIKK